MSDADANGLTIEVEPAVIYTSEGVLSLENRTALVSGGGSGIGRAAAVALAANGATVVVSGRRDARLKETVALIEQKGGLASLVVADLTDRATAARLVEVAVERHGSLDIAFNNAGYQEPRAPLATQPDEMYDQVFDVNVRAVWDCMRRQIAHMAATGGGVIVNNASVSGVRNPNSGLSLYSASKAAVISLTRSAAQEHAADGIRINMVSPGRVVTDMMLGSGIDDMSSVAAGLPAGRMGNATEVANAVVWLASDASSFTIGHNLASDGGFLAL